MLIECKNPKKVAKEMFWLAWQACGKTEGMGFMQDKPNATKENVWKNIQTSGDYPGNHNKSASQLNADYVFGRMMKLSFKIKDNGIIILDMEPQIDYQSWSCKYKTYQDLFDTANKNVNKV